MRAAGFLLIAALAGAPYVAAQAPATVTFHFEDPRMQPAKYTITLHEDGTGHFHAEGGSTSPDDGGLGGTNARRPSSGDWTSTNSERATQPMTPSPFSMRK